MSNDLTTTTIDVRAIWEDEKSLAEIKEIFCPLLTPNEFKAFIGLGKGTGLNPFLKEIFAIKYDKSKPATFVIARDGYRKSAQQSPDYDYHRVDAIYSEDLFENDNGKITHKYTLGKRGALLGAYCIVKRKNSSKDMYVTVPLHEYDQNQSVWKTMKETMIKKVAEAQALKAAFQELFAGAMSQDEYEIAKLDQAPQKLNQQTEKLKETINQKKPETIVLEDEPEKEEPKKTPPPVFNSGRDDVEISPEQIDLIYGLMDDKGFTKDRLIKALDYYKVDCVESMTDAQARLFILQLEKL